MKRYNDITLGKLTSAGKQKRNVTIGGGLYLIVYASGAKSFARMEKNAAGNNQLRPFAPFAPEGTEQPAPGAMSLTQAKTWMHEHAIAASNARAAEHHDEARARIEITWSELLTDYIAKKVLPRNDIGADRKQRIQSTLTNHFAKSAVPDVGGTWGETRVALFASSDWTDRYERTLYAIERRQAAGGDRRGKSTLGHEVDQFMQHAFDYAIGKGYMSSQHRPARNTKVRRPRAVRRYLSIAEIERLLEVTTPAAVYGNDAINDQDACFMRVLLLSGIRQNSARLARRSNMHARDKDFWTFPAEDLKETKVQREVEYEHHIPLTALMRVELARLDELVTPGVDVFFAERYHAQRDVKEVRPRSRSWAGHLVSEFAGLLGIDTTSEYRSHAFRRTQSNWMRELGVPDHVIDLCQARVEIGTAKTYLTAELRDQVVNAFEIYHAFIDACMQKKGQAFIDAVRTARQAESRQKIAQLRKAAKVRALVA